MNNVWFASLAELTLVGFGGNIYCLTDARRRFAHINIITGESSLD